MNLAEKIMQKVIPITFLLVLYYISAYSQVDPESVVTKGIHTTYVYSQTELYAALEPKLDYTADIFFITYDEDGNVHHYGTMLIQDLVTFLRREECNLPEYCVILIGDEAIRRVK